MRRSDEDLLALVHQKADAIRQRRAFTALGAGVLVVLLMATGVAVAGNGGGGKSTLRVAGEASSTTVPETTTSTSEETTTTALPAAPATTAPANRPTTTTRPAPAPLAATLTASPDKAPTATLVKFALHVTDGRGFWDGYTIDFGDGTPGQGMHVASSCAARTPGQPEPPAPTTDETKQFSHGYRRPGTYTVKAQVSTDSFCTSDPAPESRDVSVKVTVEPGADVSNGPVDPQAFVNEAWPPGRDPSRVYVSARGNDDDGYVSRITVDWGDGSAATNFDYPLSSCKDSGSTWPQSSQAADANHGYAASGKYTVHVIVTSVGCDGKDGQTATADAAVNYPSSPPA